jgi:septal ring factor EnvC (AmiA/AmiB activator)
MKAWFIKLAFCRIIIASKLVRNFMMNTIKPKLILPLLLLSFSFTLPAVARDISMEQTSASAARNEMENAQADYNEATQRISDQEKRVAQDQALLKEQQEKQAAAKIRLENAKVDLDKKLQVLDKAWEVRDR